MTQFPNDQSDGAGAIPVWIAAGPGGSFENITTATTTVVNDGPCTFQGLMVNTLGAGSIAKVYDGVDAMGTLIGTYSTAAVNSFMAPGAGISCEVGICVVTSGGTPADITVVFRA